MKKVLENEIVMVDHVNKSGIKCGLDYYAGQFGIVDKTIGREAIVIFPQFAVSVLFSFSELSRPT